MKYVLITPARNEEACIEKTIESMISQTVLPIKWVIVSDNSTDSTDKIVNNYSSEYEFIALLRTQGSDVPNFGSKVKAFSRGYKTLMNIDYDFIGNLDADVSFMPDYYERILGEFLKSTNLGIAGGRIEELVNGRFRMQKISSNSVAGAVQLFRRQCYEEIGGYVPLKLGGIDSAAEIMARSLGWGVKTFPELKVFHHRRVSCVGVHILKSRFRQGMTQYLLGYHPVFQIIKCIYRLIDKPYMLGSIFTFCGYLWASLRRLKRPIPNFTVRYLRREQINRIFSMRRELNLSEKKS